jgi:hypothetical protein
MSFEILAAVITISIIATVCLGCVCADILHKRRNRAQALIQESNRVAETSVHLGRRT